MKKCLLIVLLVLLPLFGGRAAQDVARFINFNNVNSALSSNGVKCLLEDSRGYVWMGTYRGLCRFDGTRIVCYDKTALGTSSDFISSLAEDSDGNVWIGTDDGPVLYRWTAGAFVRAFQGIPADRVFTLLPASDGRVWAGVRGHGLFSFDPDSGCFRPVPLKTSDGRELKDVYRLALTDAGRLFVVSYCDNLYELDGTLAVPVMEGLFQGDNIEGITLDEHGMLWIASKRYGLCSLNLSGNSFRQRCRLPGDSRAVNVSCDGRFVLFCTTGGLLRYDSVSGDVQHLMHNPNNPLSLSDDFINAAIRDSAGSLWVATGNSGVDFCSALSSRIGKFSALDTGESLEASHITSFAQTASGTVYVGTERLGLLTLNPSSMSLTKFRGPSAIPQSINALCTDGGNLWIGSNKGLVCLMPGGKIRQYSDIGHPEVWADNRVICLYRSQEGDIYVGTSVGLCRYDSRTDGFEPLPGFPAVAVESIVQDSRGQLWIASYSRGLFSYDTVSGTLHNYCSGTGASCMPEMTSSVCADNADRIWIMGFSSGFYRHSGDDFIAFNSSNLPSLPSDVTRVALSDDSGKLWISTDKGLVEFNPQSRQVRVWTMMDGLLNDSFRKSAIKLEDSRLLFGSDDGFIIFDAEKLSSTPSAVNVSITGMRVNGKPAVLDNNVDLVPSVTLGRDERSLGFDFSVPGAPSPAANAIFCRLRGYDENWRDVSSHRSVDYYNLKKGKYELLVGVQLEGGRILQAHRPLAITIRPRFFESVPGMLLFVLLAVLLLAAVMVWLYRKAVKSHKVSQDHDKMDFFANVIHEIKTPLTLIRTPLQHLMLEENLSEDQKEDVSLIGSSTDYLDKLVKELLEFITVEEQGFVTEFVDIPVAERLGFICSTYLEAARSRNLKLDFIAPKEEVVCAVDSKAFHKIINNLLSNALKYAESRIELEMKAETGKLLIYVRNDGPAIDADKRESIFAPFVHYSKSEVSEGQSFGIGLPLARKMAQLHGGSLVLSERRDLVEFRLELPLRTVGVVVPGKLSSGTADDLSPVANMPLLLVVEDNVDLLGYLKRKLSNDYKVIAVPSAEAALEKIRTHKVDCLLTDVGLQGMSGIELCAKVKFSSESAHIPIIVLSAITSPQTKINCMKNGATMYIEKPFSLDYLESCITSVLENRKFMKNAYAPISDPVGKVMSMLPDRDDEFIRRIDKLISDNIADPGLNNKRIEAEMFVSHSSLNRRMKELFGTTPNEYIRRKRLDVAARMLERGGVLVSDVCYAVGFNSPSYFSKCFKETYGSLPADYAKEMKKSKG